MAGKKDGSKGDRGPIISASTRLRIFPMLAVITVLIMSILVFNESELYQSFQQLMSEALMRMTVMMNVEVGMGTVLLAFLFLLVLLAILTDRSWRLLLIISGILLIPSVLGYSELDWLDIITTGEYAILGSTLPKEVVFLNGLAVVSCGIYHRAYRRLRKTKAKLQSRGVIQEELDRAIGLNMRYIGKIVLLSALITTAMAFVVWTFRSAGSWALERLGELYAVVGFVVVVLLMIVILSDLWAKHAAES